MTPLALPTFVPRFIPGQASSHWSGHLAFVHDLVAALRPALYVAVGITSASDYFGVCQTIVEEELECNSYGVLSLSDDLPVNEAAELKSYNSSHYESISRLLKTDDESSQPFSDGSIDLLRVANGRRGDEIFERWLPKVRPGGIVLVDQITKRDAGFQTWRVWEHIERVFKDRFAFHHADGLGVVRNRGGEASPSFFHSLFEGSSEQHEYVRRNYVVYGRYVESILRTDIEAKECRSKMRELTTELHAAQHERMILDAELARTHIELTRTQYERNEAIRKIAELQESIAATEAAHEATRVRMQQIDEALQAEQHAKRDLMNSFSWKLTAPARDVMEWARRRKAE